MSEQEPSSTSARLSPRRRRGSRSPEEAAFPNVRAVARLALGTGALVNAISALYWEHAARSSSSDRLRAVLKEPQADKALHYAVSNPMHTAPLTRHESSHIQYGSHGETRLLEERAE